MSEVSDRALLGCHSGGIPRIHGSLSGPQTVTQRLCTASLAALLPLLTTSQAFSQQKTPAIGHIRDPHLHYSFVEHDLKGPVYNVSYKITLTAEDPAENMEFCVEAPSNVLAISDARSDNSVLELKAMGLEHKSLQSPANNPATTDCWAVRHFNKGQKLILEYDGVRTGSASDNTSSSGLKIKASAGFSLKRIYYFLNEHTPYQIPGRFMKASTCRERATDAEKPYEFLDLCGPIMMFERTINRNPLIASLSNDDFHNLFGYTDPDSRLSHLFQRSFDNILAHGNQGLPIPPAPYGSTGLHSAMMGGELALQNHWRAGQGKQGLLTLARFNITSHSNAQATHTYVSGVGDDANPCSRTAPCKTFAGAISKTPPGGEIDALDPGGFGALTITKSIVLDGGGGQVASALVAGTNGIVVAPASNDVVIIHNLRLDGLLGNGYAGCYLDYPDPGRSGLLPTGKSIENNVDIYRAMATLSRITAQLGLTTESQQWQGKLVSATMQQSASTPFHCIAARAGDDATTWAIIAEQPIDFTVAPADTFGWNNSPVTVTFNCAHALSGVAMCTSPIILSAQGANQIVTGTATDKAGNTASTTPTMNIDETPPIIAALASPAPNAAGWNNTNVTVTFTCADTLFGIAVCPSADTIRAQGTNPMIGINIDNTPPTIGGQTTPTPNAAGWNNTNVTVTSACADNLSGINGITGFFSAISNTSFMPAVVNPNQNMTVNMLNDGGAHWSITSTTTPVSSDPTNITSYPGTPDQGLTVIILNNGGARFSFKSSASTLTSPTGNP